MDRDENRPGDDPGTWQPSWPADTPKPPPSPPEPGDNDDNPRHTRPDVKAHTGDAAESSSDTIDYGDRTTQRNDDPSTPREDGGDWDADTIPIFEKDQVVFGKYRLIEKIGEGGMGDVWRVWHVDLEAERALKLIKPEIARNVEGWQRFRREARLMAKVNHASVVTVYDFKRMRAGCYIEMELVRGRTLAEVLEEHGHQPMPLDWTARILDQLCSVLHEAHTFKEGHTGRLEARPIIHRDLKPSNLMLVDNRPPGQDLKVLDFGIAKMVEGDSDAHLTATGQVIGTPAYMSPEQIRGGMRRDGQTIPLDGRSDVYSTGVVLYQLLSGALPFRGNPMALLAGHLSHSPMPMKEANSTAAVPPDVERVVMRCLEKNPDRRFQSAAELADAFRRAMPVPRPKPLHQRTRVLHWVAAVGITVFVGALVMAAILSRSGSRGANAHHSVTPVSPSANGNAKVETRKAPEIGAIGDNGVRPPVTARPDPTPGGALTESRAIDVELTTSKPGNRFVPGEAMVIYVTNRSKRAVYIELVGTSTRGRKAILTATPRLVEAGGQFRFPEAGKSLEAGVDPGNEQITVYAGTMPFGGGTILREADKDDRIVHSSEGDASPAPASRLAVKTITIETRPARTRALENSAGDSADPPGA